MKTRLGMLTLLGLVGCGVSDTAARRGSNALVTCPVSPAGALMKNAVCVCNGLQAVGSGLTTRAAVGESADVGINKQGEVVGHFQVAGSFRAHDGISGVGLLDVRDDVVTFGAMQGVGEVKVGRDLMVQRELSDVGQLWVGGAARIGGTIKRVGTSSPLNVTAFALADALPCDCAGLDVAQAVAHASTDPSTHQLAASESVGAQTTQLTTGSYYLPSMRSVGSDKISIRGAVALYVGGDLEMVGQTLFDVPVGSTLDLYVAGKVSTVGSSRFSTPPQPGAVRLYVGGEYSSVGQRELFLSLYAPHANVQWVGDTTIHGSVLAGSLSNVGALEVDYAAPSAPAEGTCDGPPSTGDGPPSTGDGIN